jgi:hypothetical protein
LGQSHETCGRNNCNQVKQPFDALREHMTPPNPLKRRNGFATSLDRGKKNLPKGKT